MPPKQRSNLTPICLLTLVFCALKETLLGSTIPSWAIDATKILDSGKGYKVVCSGIGPSIDLARIEAIAYCKMSATELLQTNGSVKSLSIETENDLSFYQEMSESVSFKNLVCIPERESIEESSDGSFRVWIMCRFDLEKVELGSDLMKNDSKTSNPAKQNLSILKDRKFSDNPTRLQSKFRTAITIISVPPCTRLLVRGSVPRTIKCESGVNPVSISSNDEEIVVVANGYKSKTLKLKERTWSDNELIQVILESN